jgi:hypothetical protein
MNARGLVLGVLMILAGFELVAMALTHRGLG